MRSGKWILLGRLRRAVKKVTFLLNFNLNRWRLTSILGAGSLSSRWTISFNDRTGLRDDIWLESSSDTGRVDDDSGSFGRGQIQRTTSYPSDGSDDVDKRAELFIANFRNQLRMERQISMQLRYNRRDSMGFNYSPP